MKKVLYTLAAISAAAPIAVAAQGIKNANGPLSQVSNQAGVTQGDPGVLVGGIIAAVLTMVGIIFLALMVYAGILWMTARGKDDQVERAREIIIASVIGLFIVVSAYAITAFVTGRLSQ